MGFFDSIFGGPPSPGQVVQDLLPNFQYPNYGGQRTGPYPGGSSTTTGGGGINQGYTYDFKLPNKPKLTQAIEQGKYKNLTDEQRKALVSGGPVDWMSLPAWMKKDLGKKGIKMPRPEPYTQMESDPFAQEYFDWVKQKDFERTQREDAFNKAYLEPLIGKLAGLQGQAVGSASDYLKKGFTDLDPGVMKDIDLAAEGEYTSAKDSLTRDYNSSLAGVNEVLASQGVPIGRSSDSSDYVMSTLNRPLAENLKSLLDQKRLRRRELIDQRLAQQRAGYGMVLGTPTINAATSGLTLPGLNADSRFFNPTGTWDPNLVANMQQFQNNFGLQRDQLRAGITGNLVNAGVQQASAPGPGQAFGALTGAIAPALVYGNAVTNAANIQQGNPTQSIFQKIFGRA